jgi:hypothetical protein
MKNKPDTYRAFLFVALIAATDSVFAGDMDALGYAFLFGYIYLLVIFVASLVAVFACRLIGNRRMRTIARWLIVLAFYTPVIRTQPDHQVDTSPAFAMLFGNQGWAHWGWPTHPVLFAYAGAIVLSAPVVALWIYLRERYRDRPLLASQAQ